MSIVNFNQLYTYENTSQLLDASNENSQFGTLHSVYQIRRCRSVTNKQDELAYYIICMQRVIIPSEYSSSGDGHSNYPLILDCNFGISGTNARLIDYSPRSINASVITSKSGSDSSGETSSIEHTSGSVMAQTNSFMGHASLGAFGEAVDGKNGTGKNTSDGGINIVDPQATCDALSVKDWGCATSVSSCNSSNDSSGLCWIWGQEFPWNALQFNSPKGGDVTLPQNMQTFLHDGNVLMPPSQLSLFGIDFTMKSVWLIKPGTSDTIHVKCDINYATGSHKFSKASNTGSVVQASMTPAISAKEKPQSIDLFKYGLDPIGPAGPYSNALTGFIPRKFIIAPKPVTASNPASPFKIIGPYNNLLVEDTTKYPEPSPADGAEAGFTAHQTKLNATLSNQCPSLQLTVFFKILDEGSDYDLLLKHWKTGNNDIALTITFNGETTSQLVKHVRSREAEGGEDNLLQVSLRKLNFGEIDYHDVLQLGLNTIEISISLVGDDYEDGGYDIRAISVERA